MVTGSDWFCLCIQKTNKIWTHRKNQATTTEIEIETEHIETDIDIETKIKKT